MYWTTLSIEIRDAQNHSIEEAQLSGDNPKAHSTFNVQMVHGVLQVTVTIAVHCILYQGLSQGIHS